MYGMIQMPDWIRGIPMRISAWIEIPIYGVLSKSSKASRLKYLSAYVRLVEKYSGYQIPYTPDQLLEKFETGQPLDWSEAEWAKFKYEKNIKRIDATHPWVNGYKGDMDSEMLYALAILTSSLAMMLITVNIWSFLVAILHVLVGTTVLVIFLIVGQFETPGIVLFLLFLYWVLAACFSRPPIAGVRSFSMVGGMMALTMATPVFFND